MYKETKSQNFRSFSHINLNFCCLHCNANVLLYKFEAPGYASVCFYAVAKPSRPKVVVLSSQPIQLSGNNRKLRMKCLPYDVSFSYKWERKNMELPSTARGRISVQLTIINLKPKDSGEYQCVMSNSTGMIASDYILVTIKGL